jgi:hypothetical protein
VVHGDADNQATGEHAEEGTWVALKDAAAILGVSTDTVKRRMRRGELERRRETIPQGFRWLVRIDPAISEAPGSPERDEPPAHGVAVSSPSPDVMAALLHELEVRNQEIARLHDIVAALTHAVEQRPVLPVTSTGGEEPAPEPPRSPQTSETGPRGLLDRLRHWLSGS